MALLRLVLLVPLVKTVLYVLPHQALFNTLFLWLLGVALVRQTLLAARAAAALQAAIFYLVTLPFLCQPLLKLALLAQTMAVTKGRVVMYHLELLAFL
jgi:hypothetical protein